MGPPLGIMGGGPFARKESGMLRIAVVDDNERDQDHVVSLLQRYFENGAAAFAVERFADGEDFVMSYRPQFDLVFLDIEMERMDGMTCARRLRQIDREVLLVFTTNLAQYAANGYEVDALGYLVKPLRYYNFALAMRRVEEALARRSDHVLWLPFEGGRRAVSTRDLLYVEVRKHNLLYHLATLGSASSKSVSEVLESRGSLKECAQELEPYHFYPCNRYSLVNLGHVRALMGEDLVLDTGEVLDVSRRAKKSLMEALTGYFGGR